MKIALINVLQKFRKFEENLRTVSEKFWVYPPLNLAYIAALLEQNNHKAIIIDANALKLSKEQTLKQINNFKPDLIGFNLHSVYNFQDTIQWIRFIKSKTNVKIIVGGINLILYPPEIFNYKEIDFGFIGSITNDFLDFIEKLDKNQDYSQVKGLCYKKKKKTYNKPTQFPS